MRVLIVEDSLRLCGLVRDGLAARGFSTDFVHSLEAADSAIESAKYDSVILDLGLPDGDGGAWLRRRVGDRGLPPVIILTARDGLDDRIAGLDAGGDDYLVKPVDIDELAARLRAQLRRSGPRSPPVMQVGRLTFDVAARCARVETRILDLTRREANLLDLLMRRAGRVLPRGMIEDSLYTFDEPVTPNAVEATVSRLRKKLVEAGSPATLVTVRGVGYLLRDR